MTLILDRMSYPESEASYFPKGSPLSPAAISKATQLPPLGLRLVQLWGGKGTFDLRSKQHLLYVQETRGVCALAHMRATIMGNSLSQMPKIREA